jgi:outer membrane protein OmpA-like peptidoglycan-associated protein
MIDVKSNVSNTINKEEANIKATMLTTTPSAFVEAAKKNNIPQREFKDLKGLKNGYYVITGVFGEIGNAKKAIYRLRKKGFETNYISVPESGLNYVYINYHAKWENAIKACNDQFNGKFLDDVWILNAQSESKLDAAQLDKSNSNKVAINSATTLWKNKKLSSVERKSFLKTAKENNISTRKLSDLKGVKNGYYIVSGVYGDENNAKKMANGLRKKGFEADYFPNSENKLNYTFLEYHKNWENAIIPIKSKFNGSFKAKVWILQVESSPMKDKSIEISQRSFLKIAKENDISTRKLSDLKGVKNGYYIVSGVYGDENNAKKMANVLRKKGFEADYFPNSENKLNYTFLEYHKNWENAIIPIKSKFNGFFNGKVWILQVENYPIKEQLAAAIQVPEIRSNIVKKSDQIKKINKPQKNSRLLEKADSYFSKMWYAEAAELYEQLLEQSEENYTFEIIQKAGDSHYFNTNMEKAYYWYNILYEKYKDEMSADNIFKYAHSLKGTGKYARAKRLMRLYNRKIKNPTTSVSEQNVQNALPTEVILDELRNTKQDFDVLNLAINSKYSEFSPMFHNEDQVVFASANDTSIFNTRRYKWNDQPYLDLYVAKINEESQELRDAIKFSSKVNTKYHEASVTFSPDNETMYFTRNNYGKKLKRDKKGVNHLKIYRSDKLNGVWSEATEVPFNSDDYSTGHPALSPDGKLLYFVSDMPGSIGQTDIFVVDVHGDGTFSDPRNLGPNINTERKEMFPFINEEKLYFSSDGHVGLGGLDVFEAAIDEELGFLEVKNVGQPINSNKDDFSYIVNEKNQKGFFASNRRGGKGDDDIYSFKRLVLEEVPENLNAIAGVVTELVTGELMPKALVTLLDENNIKLKEMVAEDDGSFLFEDLDGNTKYTIKTTRSDYFEEEVTVTTKDNEVVNTEIALRRLKEMIAVEDGIRKLKIDMIYFDFDKSYIRKDASKELDKLVEVMIEYPNMVIKIESHTDSRGARVYNKYLSDKRAKSTRNYIISKGIDASRIQSAIGYGEERLINECNGKVRCTEAKHLLNRRSEFIIVEM